MSNEKTALRITELDFFSIRENLKTYLRSQETFQDFDFEGAGMAVLLDILAYNTHYMGYYLNMVGNEMFLDTAQLRNSVLSHAKSLNYIPGSRQGATTKLNIKVTPSNSEDQLTNIITLEKYTKLLGRDIDGVNYPFVTLNSNTAVKSSGSFNFANVVVKQGEVNTLQFLVDSTNPRRRFEIPSANVDTTSILVNIQESGSNTFTTNYILADDITELNANSTVYFLEENENLKYTLSFGDGIIGKRPKDGNIVICTYLDTVGSVSNNVSRFVFSEPVGGVYSDNVSITSASSSYGGVDKETIDQVKFRAPIFYTAQNRAVVESDYQSLLTKDYNYIDSVAVWGGEKNDPPVYGKVFVSIKTKGNYALTNFEKENIKEELVKNRNVITVSPEIIDPDYVYIQTKVSVLYDSTLTSLSSGQISNLVKAAIQDYDAVELNKFNSVFRKSRLSNYIENAEQSILGSQIDVFVQKRFKVDVGQTRSYTIPFNMTLKRSSYDNRLSSFPEIGLFDSSGILRNAFIEEVPEFLTGLDSVVVLDGGRGYTSAPLINITGDGTGAVAKAKISAGRVSSIEITDPGQNYTYALLTIIDTSGTGSGASAKVILQSKRGILRSYYFKTSGEKVILNPNVGSIDYENGVVQLNNIRIISVAPNDFYLENYMTFSVLAGEDNIYPIRNRILSIDYNDDKSILLTTVAE